jgi:integrase/recombinase XerD
MANKKTTGDLGILTQTAFIQDRSKLKNVTAKTLIHYSCAFNAFKDCDTPQEYKLRVAALRERGVKPRSINTYRTALNAYFHWVAAEGDSDSKCCSACTLHFKLGKQNVEDRMLPTFSREQVQAIFTSKPVSSDMKRAQALAAILLDTGLRMAEALALRTCDVDLENMCVRVMGKGRKERQVPISVEGRKWIYGWLKSQGMLTAQKDVWPYLFACKSGAPLSHRNAQRDVAILCGKLAIDGVRCSPHTFRHTFAASYLRAGGNLEFLRRILGHTSILTTQKYLKSLGSEDLVRVHNSYSALSLQG